MRILEDLDSLAREMYFRRRALYSQPHERVLVKLADFPNVAHAFFEQMQAELKTHDFTHAFDFVNKTRAEIYKDIDEVYRVMLSADGSTVAEIVHIRSNGRQRMLEDDCGPGTNLRVVALITEFADGGWLETNNSTRRPSFQFPQIEAVRWPGKSIAQILELHNQAIRKSGRSFVTFRGADEILTSYRRSDDTIAAFRRSTGYILPQEIESTFGCIWHPWAVRRFIEAIARVQMEEAKTRDVE